jgi:hypothetical protein
MLRRRSERSRERRGRLKPRIRGRGCGGRQIVSEAGQMHGGTENQEKRTATMVQGEGVVVDRRKGAKKSDLVGVGDGELVKEFPAGKP